MFRLLVSCHDGRNAGRQQQGADRLIGTLGQARACVHESGQHRKIAEVDDDLPRPLLVRLHGGNPPVAYHDVAIALIAATEPVVKSCRMDDERVTRFIDTRELAPNALDHSLGRRGDEGAKRYRPGRPGIEQPLPDNAVGRIEQAVFVEPANRCQGVVFTVGITPQEARL